ncbi:hypothetical protein OCT63_18375 [Vibrio sp. RW]|uniref:hypothetical protein n=1 Tax=Vibrio sp. RW TaxID=2998833 RepID=UPI0022CD5F3F|nr:hypothetical protein [Vibrio sp. RW]MDA0146196.1 hypothetical protein [Vibrio sp. RW]
MLRKKLHENIVDAKKIYLDDDVYERIMLKLLNLRLSSESKKNMLDKIATRLKDGDAVTKSLSSLLGAYKNQQPRSVETKFLKILNERYTYKPRLSYMLAPFFDSMTIGVVSAIEEEKSSHQILHLCVSNLERKNKMKGVAILGVLGPIFSMMLIIGACTGAHLWIYKNLFRGLSVEKTGLLMTMSSFTGNVYQYSPFLFVVLFIYMIWTIWSIPNQIRKRPTNLPPWNIIDSVNSAVALQTYGELLKVGVSSTDALEMIGRYQSPYVKFWCQKIRMRMVNGYTEGRALSCDFFKKGPRIEIESYALTSSFSTKIERISEEVFKSTEQLVTRMTNSILIFSSLGLVSTVALISMSMMSLKAV